MRRYLFVHGLNTTPDVWDELASTVESEGEQTVRVLLKGHDPDQPLAKDLHFEDWIHDIENAMEAHPSSEWVGVGFSLGGLSLTYLSLQRPGLFKRLILLAPALAIQPWVYSAKLLFPWPNTRTTSMTPKHIRAHASINMHYLQAIFELQKRTVENFEEKASDLPPTTVFMAWHDELVNYHGVKKLCEKHEQVDFVQVKPKRRSLTDWGHLVVDSSTMPEEDWKKVVSAVLNHQKP